MFIRYAFGFIAFLSSVFASGQKAGVINVSGKLDYVKEEKRLLDIMYRKIGGGYEFDSCAVINGRFQFQKEVEQPIVAVMSLKAQQNGAPSQGVYDYVSLFLLPGDVKIEATENLRNCAVSGKGAIANADYQGYLSASNRYVDTLNSLLTATSRSTLPNEQKEKRLTEIADSINAIRDQQVYLNFLTTKTQSPVAALALLQYGGEPVWRPRKKMVPEEIEKLIARLPKNLQAYPVLQNLKEELLVAKRTGTGKPIIDFELEDTSGKKVKLSDFKGQYVFLDFWASWCVPCRKENPNVINQFKKYKDQGFTVVSVSLDKPDARQAWIEAVRKDGIGIWPQLGDLHGFDGDVAKSYYVKSIPTNFLIGPDGNFIERNLYGEALGKSLEKIFVNKK